MQLQGADERKSGTYACETRKPSRATEQKIHSGSGSHDGCTEPVLTDREVVGIVVDGLSVKSFPSPFACPNRSTVIQSHCSPGITYPMLDCSHINRKIWPIWGWAHTFCPSLHRSHAVQPLILPSTSRLATPPHITTIQNNGEPIYSPA